jgi:hypothetical protein
MSYLLAIDPGGACLGWALFEDGVLIEVGLSRTKEQLTGARARHHALILPKARGGRVVSEMMRYRGSRSGIPPQDLVELNLIAGHVGSEWVYPDEWKGRVPKEIHQPRILKALTPEELYLVEGVRPPTLRHNAIDAVGIGLYCLGRLKPEVQDVQRKRSALLVGKSQVRPSPSRKRRRPSGGPRPGGANTARYPRTRPSRSRG